MEWSKSKSTILLSLVVLNLFLLGALLYTNMNSYVLASRNVENIQKILTNNDITFDGNLEKDFSPKSRINVSFFDFNTPEFLDNFFTDRDNLVMQLEEDNYGSVLFYMDENEGNLSIRENGFEFWSKEKLEIENFTYEDIFSKVNTLTDSLGKEFESFTFDNASFFEIKEKDTGKVDAYICYLRDNYGKYMINNNYIRIAVNSDKTYHITCWYLKPIGYVDDTKREILSSAEALVRIISEKSLPPGTKITSFELVYNSDIGGNKDDDLIPYYRVFLEEDSEEPILVNAYLGDVS